MHEISPQTLLIIMLMCDLSVTSFLDKIKYVYNFMDFQSNTQTFILFISTLNTFSDKSSLSAVQNKNKRGL